MAAKQLFSQAQGGKLHKQSVAAVEEQPTAITKASVGGETRRGGNSGDKACRCEEDFGI